MRRILFRCLVASVLLVTGLSLAGCIVVPPRGGYHERVWVPGHWAPGHLWVDGHWH